MKSICFSKIEEALGYMANSSKDKGLVLFSSIENVAMLSKTALSNVILCSTAGEYTYDGFQDGVITGFEYNLDGTEIVEIPSPPAKALCALKSAYSKVKANKNAFMLLLCDGLSGTEESVITTLYFMDSEFKIIGGSAGDNLKFKETLIYIGSKRISNLALFVNSKAKTSIVKENIYSKTSEALLVTKADLFERTVKTFNNKPASSEYARLLGVSESSLSSHFMNNPVGKPYKDDVFIASPMRVNPDKSMTFYCQLMENTFVHLLKAENPIDILKSTLSEASFKPSFVFVINCILRSLKFQEENLWREFDREILKFCRNTTGFISYGEQYYKRHANQSMVMLLVE